MAEPPEPGENLNLGIPWGIFGRTKSSFLDVLVEEYEEEYMFLLPYSLQSGNDTEGVVRLPVVCVSLGDR